ncbi:transglutaminase family protein [Stieleria sp. TO1_6]|uniref:transglutaminase-like domain-containing protein n=1 Tax=Stieleria tagensis TaxID=2956795 RepID=UPI00209B0808|nr:transglutaminase family protein [Stieleria tagensis]MCO8125259.1 transglutaminase family protein [Stieleria tagensis]
MTQIQIGSQLNYTVRQETLFLFLVEASQTQHQSIVSESLTFDPQIAVETCNVGPEGNRLCRVVVQPCELSVSYQATVEMTPDQEPPQSVCESDVSQMPADVLPYMNPSRYCESDLLARFAFEEFGQLNRGYTRVQAICDWVNSHLDYTPGSTNTSTTATDVLLQRTGVCRDYAHLAVSLCRGIGIPARYVCGYAVGLQPPDFHGFMEAFLDGRWYLFDPTKLAETTGLVRIGVGRDAADVAFATITGDATLNQQNVWAQFADGNGNANGSSDGSAVSTA